MFKYSSINVESKKIIFKLIISFNKLFVTNIPKNLFLKKGQLKNIWMSKIRL